MIKIVFYLRVSFLGRFSTFKDSSCYGIQAILKNELNQFLSTAVNSREYYELSKILM